MSKDLEILEVLRKNYEVTDNLEEFEDYQEGKEIFYQLSTDGSEIIVLMVKDINYTPELENFILQLQNLEALALRRVSTAYNVLIHFDQKYSVLQKLFGLYLDEHSGIVFHADLLLQYKNLKRISVANVNDQEQFFRNLENLSTLESLEIPFLPEKGLGSIASLRNLSIRVDKSVIEVPEWIGQLTSLEYLKMWKSVEILPASFFKLANLKSLDLSGCQELKTLPDEFGRLTSLESLNLIGSGISALPDSLCKLVNLKSLHLSECTELKTLPDEFGRLTSLESLNLWRIRISALPDSFCKLVNLKSLNLLFCQGLKTLPDEFGQLTSLESLNLRETNISALPYSFFKLANLKSLDLSSCQELKTLPDEFGQLTSLESLNLGGTSISALPDSFFNLANLKSLNLSHCEELKTLPDEFGQLTSLESFKISDIRISDSPESFEKLDRLAELDIQDSFFRSLRLPKSINRLTVNDCPYMIGFLENSLNAANLIELNISNQSIRYVRKIIENSTLLQNLNCSNNSIQFLPESFLNLNDLQRIDFSKNKIQYIAPEICRFLISKNINLKKAFEGNPIHFPPIEILEKGNQAVLDFLDERERQTEELPQYRVILAGEGGAGKSSVVDVLTGRGFDNSKETTKEIRIVTEPYMDREMTVHYWDFGGQEIMHSAHRMFFTDNTLYLIVLDSRKEEKPDEWLRFIKSKIKNATVIILLNKIDMNPKYRLSLDSLRKNYGFVKNIYTVSCQTGEGFENLKRDLFSELKNNYIEPPAENWISVKHRLKSEAEQNRKYIDEDRFYNICKDCGISHPDNLRNFLHQMGFLFEFSSSKSVLNTEWLIKGIYPIITSEEIQNRNGRIQTSDYEKIFKNNDDTKKFSLSDFKDLLDLMEDKKLCFKENRDYVFPALLSEDYPQNPYPKVPIINQLKIFLEYKGYLSPSVFYQFISEIHKYSPDRMYWKNGILIEMESNSAIILMNENDRRIEIRIQGTEKEKFFISSIFPIFKAIHKDFFLEYEILVNVPVSEPELTLEVNYKELEYLKERKQEEYLSYKTKKRYDIHKIFEKSDSAVIKEKDEESQDELEAVYNKRLDELLRLMGVKEESRYKTDLLQWLSVDEILFGKIFEKENQNRMINAESLYHFFNANNASDYAMCIAQFCRTIEGELKAKFFTNAYRMSDYDNTIMYELESELTKDRNLIECFSKKGKEHDLQFGKLLNAYTTYHTRISSMPLKDIKFFEPYRTFTPKDNDKFIKDSDNIRDRYRNKAAHPDSKLKSFSKDDADVFRSLAKEWFTQWIEGWSS